MVGDREKTWVTAKTDSISFLIPLFIMEKLYQLSVEENRTMDWLIRRALSTIAHIELEALNHWERRFKNHKNKDKAVWQTHNDDGKRIIKYVTMPNVMAFRLRYTAEKRGVSYSWLCVTALMPMLDVTFNMLDTWAGYEIPKKKEYYKGIFEDLRRETEECKLW